MLIAVDVLLALGPIPVALAELHLLNSLWLSGNQLTGKRRYTLLVHMVVTIYIYLFFP